MDTDTESIARASSRATRRRARPTRTPAGSMVWAARPGRICLRSEEHTSELQSPCKLVCRLLLEKKHSHPTRREIALEAGPLDEQVDHDRVLAAGLHRADALTVHPVLGYGDARVSRSEL